MIATNKIQARRFYIPAGDDKALKMKPIGDYLRAFPSDKNCRIVITEGKEKRREAQNDLWWVWNQELATIHHNSYTAEQHHAMNKLDVLLPLMCHEWERWREEGELIHEAICNQSKEAARLTIALRCIRSSELSVSEGSRYTDRLVEYWAGHGVTLEIKASTKKYADYPEVHA